MAPLSRFYALAFGFAGMENNRVRHLSIVHEGYNVPNIQFQESMRRHHLPNFVASLAAPSDVVGDSQSSFESVASNEGELVDLTQLYELFKATPIDLLRLETSEDGVRGVHVNRDVEKDDAILSIPLDSCLRDDVPPDWFLDTHKQGDPAMEPDAWASRLAAALIDKQLELSSSTEGIEAWLQLLPDCKFLRASLPIHWNEELLSSARCTALELAVDSASFARANAIADITMALPESENIENSKEGLCDNALDVVQTRSCRVETADGRHVIRLLAPIFDFINHASCPNAAFALEDDCLVVRASMDLHAGDQVFIDYGESSRPSWRCLFSYGFVPEYSEKDESSNTAEVYVHGRRFEVGPSSIPLALVEEVEAHVESEGFYERPEVNEAPETVLSPEVALRIANRVSEVAFRILLDPDQEDITLSSLEDGDEEEETNDGKGGDVDDKLSPEDVISARLAASLRFAQYRTLLSCANGLIDWREGNNKRRPRRRAEV